MDNRPLRRAYLRYNRKYFDNKLPRDLAVEWKRLPAATFGQCWMSAAGPERIEINSRIAWSGVLVRGTLLHEMSHAKLRPGVKHGPKFDAEMLRIAKRGALKGIW